MMAVQERIGATYRWSGIAGSRCPCCGSGSVAPFYSIERVPANSCLLFDSREVAINCCTGEIVLGFCDDCGFVYNTACDPRKTEYSSRYEETQGFSPTFSSFHRDLARRLIDRHDLRHRRVLEIGCGKGEFLLLLAQLGGNTCVGVDPSARQDRIAGVDGADKVTLIPEYYDPSFGAAGADLVVCKMTLEHITEPAVFISTIRAGLADRPDTPVFFQIPEASRIFRTGALEDIYYEHFAYFAPGPLAALFRRCGFEVLDVGTEYDDQYLTIEARPAAPGAASAAGDAGDDLVVLRDLVATFPIRVARTKVRWRRCLNDLAAGGGKALIWGSGSKAVAFLTTPGLGETIDHVTDINPHRQGHYLPMTGQRIVSPQELPDLQPDLVIAMNRIYRREIAGELAKLGVSCELKCL